MRIGCGDGEIKGIESKTADELKKLASELGNEFTENAEGFPKLKWEK